MHVFGCITRYHTCTSSWNRAVPCHRGGYRSWYMNNGCMLTWGMWWSSPVSLSMPLSSRPARSQGNILFRYTSIWWSASIPHQPFTVDYTYWILIRHYIAATNTFHWVQAYCWKFIIELYKEYTSSHLTGFINFTMWQANDHLLCSLSWLYCLLVLQVDSLVDVGVPAYSQLQKLKGQSLGTADTPNGKRNVCAL